MTAAVPVACALCGLDCEPGTKFCCIGCMNVHAILVESGAAEPGQDLRETELFRRSLALGLVANKGRAKTAAPLPAGIETREKTYQIGGMWCASCEWLIEHTLAKEAGVAQAEVFFASDVLKLRYYPQYLPPGRVEERLRSLGYTATEYNGENKAAENERKSLLLRLGVAAFLWVNVMTLNLAVYIGYFESLGGSMRRLLPWIVMALAAPVILYSAQPIWRLALGGLRQGIVRMETLLALGIVSAYGYSAIQAVRGGTHIYFDIACAIVTLVLLGKWVERGAKENAARAITTLYRTLPSKARILRGGLERFVSIDALREGDEFVVKTGERIPADGIVREGESHADESIVTGESQPVAKFAGAPVLGGSLNTSGVLRVQATTVGENSTLAQIVRTVERALSSRTGMERLVDRISRAFVPAVIAIAAAVGLGAYATGTPPGDALMRAVTVLVIACPCALGIATPLALTAAVGAASRAGLLITDSRVLEAAGKIDTVVIDKTGTLTEGRFELLDGGEEDLAILAAVERFSEHPLGRAVVEAAEARGLTIPMAAAINVHKGQGVSGSVNDEPVLIGNRRFVRGDEDSLIGLPSKTSDNCGVTEVEYSIGNRASGVLRFGDHLRSDAKPLVAALHAARLRVIVVSGDSRAATEAIAREAGADDFAAEALPDGKLEFIQRLQSYGHSVAMIGDGVNDAPALAQANLGVAMGSGTDVAMKASAMVLMGGQLSRIPAGFRLAILTLRVVKQNLFWAFFYNVFGIGLAAAGLLNPIVAACAMVTSSLFVIGNSHRLSKIRLDVTTGDAD